jgi:hypothetical protein
LPGTLRREIAQERAACRAARTYHTPRLIELRDRAYAELKARSQ